MEDLDPFMCPPYVGEDGIWSQQIRPFSEKKGTALFLDRDGVIVDEVNYLHRLEDIRLTKMAATVIRAANKRQIPTILITNQSGIGRGKYTWKEFALIQNAILAELEIHEAFIDAVYACPFHESANPPWNVVNHTYRKPRPGMLLRAAEMLPIRLSDSWIIGDRANDLSAGKNAGLAGGIHVLSGHGNDYGERSKALALADEKFVVYTGADIGVAINTLPLFS